MSPKNVRNRQRRGSALIYTLILATALLIVVASLLSVVTTDKRINRGVAILDEARNAAEGAVEVAAAEFDRRAVSYGTIPDDPLNGFTIPDSVRTSLAAGNVVADSIDFKAGLLSPTPESPTVIDASDPFNYPDPDKGKPVSLRHGYIYGKATATDPNTGKSVTSYVSTLVQVRTQSWLNYGIFGNLDLEFHAGPSMSVRGPVHSNQEIFLLGGSDLLFFDACTTTEKMYRRFKDNGTTASHTGAVKFPPIADASSGDLLTMSTTQDSTLVNFKDFAEARWNGFVQDVTFGVEYFAPPGMLEYVEDDYTTTGVDETRNHAYAFIEPQLSTLSSDDASNFVFAGHKGTEIENLKVSAVAGLTVRVKDWTTSDWSAISQADNDNADFDANPGFELVYFTATDTSRPLSRGNFPQRSTDGRPVETVIPTTASRMSAKLRNRLFAAIRLVRYEDSGTVGNSALVGTQFKIETDSNLEDASDTTPTLTSLSSSEKPTWYAIYDRRQGYVYPNSAGTNTNNGLRGAHHALYVDLGKFNEFLNAPTEEWEDQASSGAYLYNPATHWSGVLYVQFPLAPITDSAVAARTSTDGIRPARAPTTTNPGYALILRNCKQLPYYASRPDDGFVAGTNGPAYICGHFNADGSSSTGSSSDPDPGWDEIPAIIAADAITLLSSDWATADTHFRDSYSGSLNNAAFTEVSAALFAGVIPTRLTTSGTGTNGQRMGGVHNFARYLENWSGDTYRYRGSMALLFESEVSIQPYYESKHSYWYSAPTRDVGYHLYFANGTTPNAWPPFLRSNRRIKVDQITAADYDAGPPQPE